MRSYTIPYGYSELAKVGDDEPVLMIKLPVSNESLHEAAAFDSVECKLPAKNSMIANTEADMMNATGMMAALSLVRSLFFTENFMRGAIQDDSY